MYTKVGIVWFFGLSTFLTSHSKCFSLTKARNMGTRQNLTDSLNHSDVHAARNPHLNLTSLDSLHAAQRVAMTTSFPNLAIVSRTTSERQPC